jgi:hypothetical protein
MKTQLHQVRKWSLTNRHPARSHGNHRTGGSVGQRVGSSLCPNRQKTSVGQCVGPSLCPTRHRTSRAVRRPVAMPLQTQNPCPPSTFTNIQEAGTHYSRPNGNAHGGCELAGPLILDLGLYAYQTPCNVHISPLYVQSALLLRVVRYRHLAIPRFQRPV